MDRKYNSESKNVRWSTVVLSVSLLLVYVVLFYVKWDVFKSYEWSLNVISDNTWIVLSEVNDNNESVELIVSHLSWSSSDDYVTWNIQLKPVLDEWNDWVNTWLTVVSEINLWQWSSTSRIINSWWMSILPWTRTYYGDLDFANLMWISYKYALTDSKWIYYLNMDWYTYDFSDIARKLWWNLYIMNTESEILANKMFGNKVTYINIPDYADKKVLMLIDINNQSRLLAVDYAIYHQSKSYLKSLFIY